MTYLEIKKVSKKYAAQQFGLKDFSITFSNGIIGLLGQNGAGKSTLIKMIATIHKPSSGEILWNGINISNKPNDLRKVLGYLPQDFGVYPNLTAYEFLEYIAVIKGVTMKNLSEKINHLLDQLNLLNNANHKLSTFSGGMIQRVGIAQVLINDPEIILLDEPTIGLDPEERIRFRDLLSEISKERLIILSSHIVSDLQTMANKIAIMKEGQLLAYQTQEKLLNFVENKIFETTVIPTELSDFKNEFQVISSFRNVDGFKVRFIKEQKSDHFESVKPSLEDAYMYLNIKNQQNEFFTFN